MTHTGVKPYMCDKCSRCCSRTSYLQKYKEYHCEHSSKFGNLLKEPLVGDKCGETGYKTKKSHSSEKQ